MSDAKKVLQQSAVMMKITGWGVIAVVVVGLVYPPGFLWGRNPAGFPFICWQHPPSPYDGLHPYVFMIGALYLAWAILMIRGATDPRANAALFDYGILANLLHAGLMIPHGIHLSQRTRPYVGGRSRAIGVEPQPVGTGTPTGSRPRA